MEPYKMTTTIDGPISYQLAVQIDAPFKAKKEDVIAAFELIVQDSDVSGEHIIVEDFGMTIFLSGVITVDPNDPSEPRDSIEVIAKWLWEANKGYCELTFTAIGLEGTNSHLYPLDKDDWRRIMWPEEHALAEAERKKKEKKGDV
jgi:hypothetical protein